jgi:two-component system, cell cycle response regulator DivK
MRKKGKRTASASGKPLILVVDDLEDSRAMYSEYLEHVGYRVDTAADGASAVQKARALLPAAIIMDLSLPVMDGWEATRTLKSDPKTSHITILTVSGHGEPPYRDRAMEAGASAFLIKPCLPSEVANAVEECLSATTRRARKT